LNIFFNIIISALFSFSITHIYIEYFPTLDVPNKRSSHSKITVTGGGIGFVITSFIFSLISIYQKNFGANLFFIICLPLAIVGFFDDKLNLSRKIRFLIQMIIVFVIIFFAINYQNSIIFQYFNSNETLFIISIPILILFGSGFINLINFMDGMDGLLASTTSITFLYLGLFQDNFYLIILGSLIPFIFLNWEPAKVFMGDIGSTYIGGLILSAFYSAPSLENAINIILINSPLLIDASICVVLRAYNKDNIFKPHKLHLYQRLNQKGFSHSKVTIIYFVSTLIITFSVLLGNNFIKVITTLIIITLGLILNNKIAKPFKLNNDNRY